MINRGFWVVCDDCTATNDSTEWYRDTAVASARAEGWKVSANGKALCPDCQK